MQAHLDRGQGKLEQARNLFSGEPVRVMEQQNRFMCIGQVGNVPLHTLAHLRLLDDGERRWLLLVSYRQVFDWRIHLPLHSFRPLTQTVDADVSRDLVEPACQCCRVSQ